MCLLPPSPSTTIATITTITTQAQSDTRCCHVHPQQGVYGVLYPEHQAGCWPALVEVFAAIFCCLKDSSDFSQVCVCVCGVIVALYPGLLAPAFVACSTNAGEGLVKLSHMVWRTWTYGGVAHSWLTIGYVHTYRRMCSDSTPSLVYKVKMCSYSCDSWVYGSDIPLR